MDKRDSEKLERLGRYLQWTITLACIAVLGSCVKEISDVGGGHDSNQKIAGIFFFHLFLIVPCLFGLFVYLRVKLEKLLLSKETIESLNKAHMQYAQEEAKRHFGPLNFLFKGVFKKKRK